jgi:Ca2+-binding RTX toxin-like protein
MRGFIRRPGRKSLLVALTAALAVGIATVAFAATVICTGGPCVGTNSADVIAGTAGNDQISARGGNDSVIANQGGQDYVSGSTGNDFIQVDESAGSRIDGGLGSDRISGAFGGGDSFNGGWGNDSLVNFGGAPYTLTGGPNNDMLFSVDARGGDTLNGGAFGSDFCVGDAEGTDQDTFIGCETISNFDTNGDGN